MIDDSERVRCGETLAHALGLSHVCVAEVLRAIALFLAAMMLCCGVVVRAQAQPGVPASSTSPSTVRPDVREIDAAALSVEYGLSQEEVLRYRMLLRGARAHWTADTHPLMVLGVHARSDRERRRYAELLVEDDKQRTSAILALSRSVQQVWLDRYGHEPLFARPVSAPVLQPTDRVLLAFAPGRCLPCSQAISRLLADVVAHGGPGLDLYLLVDTDAEIQAFARQQLIAPEAVQRRQVTLNRASPAWLEQLGLDADALPLAVRRRGDQLTPIELNQLAQRSALMPPAIRLHASLARWEYEAGGLLLLRTVERCSRCKVCCALSRLLRWLFHP